MREFFSIIADYPLTSIFLAICLFVGINHITEIITSFFRAIGRRK